MLVKSACKCEKCNYNASTETVIKRHITSKHKHLSKTPEKSRESILNDSLRFAEDIEKKRDGPDNSIPKEVTVKEPPLKCEYWNCNFNCQDRSDLENHIHVKHVVNKSFEYPESTEELECVYCDLEFLADLNYSTHVYVLLLLSALAERFCVFRMRFLFVS